jgi:hypothetical protein
MPADKKRVGFNDKGRLVGNDLARLKRMVQQYSPSTEWGTITGTLSSQTDLQAELTALATVTKTGATQVAASAATGELWYTTSHATLPDGVVMRGL